MQNKSLTTCPQLFHQLCGSQGGSCLWPEDRPHTTLTGQYGIPVNFQYILSILQVILITTVSAGSFPGLRTRTNLPQAVCHRGAQHKSAGFGPTTTSALICLQNSPCCLWCTLGILVLQQGCNILEGNTCLGKISTTLIVSIKSILLPPRLPIIAAMTGQPLPVKVNQPAFIH